MIEYTIYIHDMRRVVLSLSLVVIGATNVVQCLYIAGRQLSLFPFIRFKCRLGIRASIRTDSMSLFVVVFVHSELPVIHGLINGHNRIQILHLSRVKEKVERKKSMAFYLNKLADGTHWKSI